MLVDVALYKLHCIIFFLKRSVQGANIDMLFADHNLGAISTL